MSTNKTTNLGLHSWVRSDRFSMDEFNENFNKLDKAVGENSAAASTALSSEAQARKAADDALTAALAAETKARQDALAAETKARQDALAAETQARQSADSTEAAARQALEKTVAKCGNCRIEHRTYTGQGRSGFSNQPSLTFDAPPLMLIIIASSGQRLVAIRDSTSTLVSTSGGSTKMSVVWDGNTVSWYGSSTDQFDVQDSVYHAIAFFAADK